MLDIIVHSSEPPSHFVSCSRFSFLVLFSRRNSDGQTDCSDGGADATKGKSMINAKVMDRKEDNTIDEEEDEKYTHTRSTQGVCKDFLFVMREEERKRERGRQKTKE